MVSLKSFLKIGLRDFLGIFINMIILQLCDYHGKPGGELFENLIVISDFLTRTTLGGGHVYCIAPLQS